MSIGFSAKKWEEEDFVYPEKKENKADTKIQKYMEHILSCFKRKTLTQETSRLMLAAYLQGLIEFNVIENYVKYECLDKFEKQMEEAG